MLRGLRQAFEAVSNERSANVLMICSSVPKVFCAGADLKVQLLPLCYVFLIRDKGNLQGKTPFLCNNSQTA